MTRKIPTLAALALVFSAAACGGTTVVEEDGGSGGAGGAGSTSAPSATGATTSTGGTTVATSTGVSTGVSTGTAGPGSSSSGTPVCAAHRDCPADTLCIFSTGECARACEAEGCDSCGEGTVCDGCATSTSPDTLDCRAACVPTPAGRCDDDDRCPADQVCVFGTGLCMPSCENDACADPSMVCADCVTGSCCGCRNCVSACVPLD